jgi:protein gp37
VTAATDELVAPPPTEPGRLNKPWRAFVALAELVAAAVAVWFAFDVWPRGIAKIVEHYPDGLVLESTRWVGSWMALAILLGTVAAVLAVDAVRQVALAVRTRPRQRR